MDRKLRTPLLSRSIRDYIKDYIIDHELKAGDPLPSEGQFAEELGVSRSPVREAVKALQSLGMIDARHGEGLFVREWNLEPVLETLTYGLRVNPESLQELYQIRVWLETAIIGDAVKKITAAEIGALEFTMLQWKQALAAGQPYLMFDQRLHQIICGVMNNDTLSKLLEVFWVAFEKYGEIDLLMARDPQRAINEHQAVVDAIKLRDPDLARAALQQQFVGFGRRIAELAAKLSANENESEP